MASPAESAIGKREHREHSGADWLNSHRQKVLHMRVGQYVVRVKHKGLLGQYTPKAPISGEP